MLDENLVFHKTEAGAKEIASPTHSLSPKLRRALIMVDGTKSVAELAPMFRPGEAEAIFLELQAQGLLTLAGGALAPASEQPAAGRAPAAAPVTAALFDEVRRRAMNEISHRLGPNGDTLALKIERCRTPDELRAALREAETILSSFLGADYARSFAQKVGRDLI